MRAANNYGGGKMKQSAISAAAAAMGRIGGAVRCAKGFASKRVQKKAQLSREINRLNKNK
jgi:hypothetical protein